MKIDCWRLIQWFRGTPHRSSDRAHKVSKQIRFAKRKYLYHTRVGFGLGELSEAALTEGFDPSSMMIYWSLLEHRTSLFIPSISKKRLILFLRSQLRLIKNHSRTAEGTNVSLNIKDLNEEGKSDPDIVIPHCSDTPQSKSGYQKYQRDKNSRATHVRNQIDDPAMADDSGTSPPGRHMFININKYEQMNRKLVRIEAVPNDSVAMGKCKAAPAHPPTTEDSNGIVVHELTDLFVNASAYELTNLIPRSINRTSSKFGAELTNQSNPRIFHDFQLANHQASASLKTIGSLISFFFLIHAILKNEFSEPWVGQLRNEFELQVFLNPFQEERASTQFRRTEGLSWLGETMKSSVGLRLQNCDTEKTCDGNIQSIIIYNELNTQFVLCVASDAISLAIPILLLAVGRRRLAALNPWIRELFYSLSDTMKAFFILLVTDSCVGFHSPHGWEIVTGCFLEHVGFSRDRYVISCFVSTFPVISDTVSKYWIFRHLNRASPSIVATYHTTNE
uniref:chloroplast envelope membrane protein n=1 Tax=Schizaea pusilla TaxID=148579 RepID=UPI00211F1559|nr:chloroplast envelope membrane protein [Schizaea pusilla]UTV01478.1 chloroplast envelope membrane protein [Schizaea pusilla]